MIGEYYDYSDTDAQISLLVGFWTFHSVVLYN